MRLFPVHQDSFSSLSIYRKHPLMNDLLMHKSRIQRKWPVGFQKDFVHILILLLYSQYPFKLINFLISFNIRYDVSRALNKNSWSRFSLQQFQYLYNLLFPIYEHLLYLCVRDIISFIEGIFQIFPMRMIQRIYQP